MLARPMTLLTIWTWLAAGTGTVLAESPVYELRTYVCLPGRLDALHARFRDHTLGFFTKHGMKNVAYWTPADGPEAETTLIYLLEHRSREAARASWDKFRQDAEWKAVAQASEADGKILASPPKSQYFEPCDYSPAIRPPSAGKVYEMRVYTAAEGKAGALHARFRDHTDRLFTRHGLKSYAYLTPLQPDADSPTLVYWLESESRDASQASFAKFVADPDWQSAKQESEVDGKLVGRPVESRFLKLTDYSPTAR